MRRSTILEAWDAIRPANAVIKACVLSGFIFGRLLWCCLVLLQPFGTRWLSLPLDHLLFVPQFLYLILELLMHSLPDRRSAKLTIKEGAMLISDQLLRCCKRSHIMHVMYCNSNERLSPSKLRGGWILVWCQEETIMSVLMRAHVLDSSLNGNFWKEKWKENEMFPVQWLSWRAYCNTIIICLSERPPG